MIKITSVPSGEEWLSVPEMTSRLMLIGFQLEWNVRFFDQTVLTVWDEYGAYRVGLGHKRLKSLPTTMKRELLKKAIADAEDKVSKR